MAVIAVHTSNNRISSIRPNDTVADPDTAEFFYIVLNDTELADLVDLHTQAKANGRPPSAVILWDGNAFVLAPDNRPFVDITSDLSEIEMAADGSVAVPATLTIQVLKTDGSNNTTFSGTRTGRIFGRFMKFSFTNGLATKVYIPRTTSDQGVRRLESNAAIKIKTPAEIKVVEV